MVLLERASLRRMQKFARGGEPFEKVNAAVDRARDIFGEDGLRGIMADAPWRAEENHGRWDVFGENHRVMAGAAGHAMQEAACRTHGGLDLRDEKRVHGDRALLN